MIYNFLFSNSKEELERWSGEVLEFTVPAKDIDEARGLAIKKALKDGFKFVLIFVFTPEPVGLEIVDVYSEVIKAAFERWFK